MQGELPALEVMVYVGRRPKRADVSIPKHQVRYYTKC